MQFKTFLGIFLALAALGLSAPAMPKAFNLYGKWHSMRWKEGAPGTVPFIEKQFFPGVYCLNFPAGETAIEVGYGLFNRGSIFLTQVRYPEETAAFIVSSTLPVGRDAEDEMARMLARNRESEADTGVKLNISTSQTPFGPTINLRIRNVQLESEGDPFPLVRTVVRDASSRLLTMSVHRLFVRGPDRFEVAAFQLAPKPVRETTEQEMTERLTVLADQIVEALWECTGAMPIRVPKQVQPGESDRQHGDKKKEAPMVRQDVPS